MNLDDVKTITRKTLTDQLSSYGFDHVDVEPGTNFGDEDALFMTATYKSGSKLPGGSVLNQTLALLRKELQKAGEERFPYLTHHLEGEELEYDDEDAPE